MNQKTPIDMNNKSQIENQDNSSYKADVSATGEAFQMPKEFQKLVDKKDRVDTGFEAQKKRLEKQLNDRKHYVSLLEEKQRILKEYVEYPKPELSIELDHIQSKIDLFNLNIEVVAQQHIFVDTYVYYKEDFMKRYKQGGGKKKSIFKQK